MKRVRMLIIASLALAAIFMLANKIIDTSVKDIKHVLHLPGKYVLMGFFAPGQILLQDVKDVAASDGRTMIGRNSDIVLLSLKDGKTETMPSIAVKKIDQTLVEEGQAKKIYFWGTPCLAKNSKIIQLANAYDEQAYGNFGESFVLIRNLNGDTEMLTLEAIGAKYKREIQPFFQNEDCTIGIVRDFQKTQICQNFPFSCNSPNNWQYDLRKGAVLNIHDNLDMEDPDEWPITLEFVDFKGESKTLKIPAGPFVERTGLIKGVKCFSCGCSCYQHLSIAFVNETPYALAYGWAINDDVRGFYKWENGKWAKIARLPQHAKNFKSDGKCFVVWENHIPADEDEAGADHISWYNACGADQKSKTAS